MTFNPSSPRYHASSKDIRKQLPMLLPIVVMFFVSILYVSGLRDPTVRTVMLYVSFVFPAVIVLSLLLSIPKMHYYQLDSEGVHITLLGFIRRHIYWADIDRIGTTYIGNVEGLGLLYNPSFNRYVFGRASRRKMFGWDELLGNAHRADGASLIDDAIKSAKKYASRVS